MSKKNGVSRLSRWGIALTTQEPLSRLSSVALSTLPSMAMAPGSASSAFSHLLTLHSNSSASILLTIRHKVVWSGVSYLPLLGFCQRRRVRRCGWLRAEASSAQARRLVQPATTPDGQRICRKDFCGWSALGPISLLIEDVLGFYHIDANTKTIFWHKHLHGKHGIRRLKFGEIITDIIADEKTITVTSNMYYHLQVNGEVYSVKPGTQSWT